MADVFLSYAREDRERAEPIVGALQKRGWTVFWDTGILPGPRFRQVLEKELTHARCVLVLWSNDSVHSEWVHGEAQRALERGVLLAARIDNVRPPLGFGERQVADLVTWNGDPEAAEFKAIVRAICNLIGGCNNVIVRPLDFNLITGDPQKYGDLPPTVNMMCELSNGATLPLTLERLALIVTRNGKSVYQMIWHLFYNAIGLEHEKVRRDEEILVTGASSWQRGVQLRESRADIPNVWPAAWYEFELLGWTDRPPDHTPPNLKTRFRAEVEPWVEREMTRWSRATTAEWDARDASDRALGFPLDVTDLTTGL
jgi:hypothetical protein